MKMSRMGRRLIAAAMGGTLGWLMWFGMASLFPRSDDADAPLYPLRGLLWPLAGVLAAAIVGALFEAGLGRVRVRGVATAWAIASVPGVLLYLAGWCSDHGLPEKLSFILAFWCEPLSLVAFAAGCWAAGPLAGWLTEPPTDNAD